MDAPAVADAATLPSRVSRDVRSERLPVPLREGCDGRVSGSGSGSGDASDGRHPTPASRQTTALWPAFPAEVPGWEVATQPCSLSPSWKVAVAP